MLFFIIFIGYLCFLATGPGPDPHPLLAVTSPGPQVAFTGPGPQFVFACFLKQKFVIVTMSTYINSASTYMYLFLSIIREISKLFEISS